MVYVEEVMAEKILIADDSVSMRQMSTFILTQAGYEVIQAVDGVDALAKFTEDVKAVLTDLNMPKMNGLEFITAIRAGNINKTVPIILVTTEFEDGPKQEARKAGATAWVVKPYNQESLLGIIKKVTRPVKF